MSLFSEYENHDYLTNGWWKPGKQLFARTRYLGVVNEAEEIFLRELAAEHPEELTVSMVEIEKGRIHAHANANADAFLDWASVQLRKRRERVEALKKLNP